MDTRENSWTHGVSQRSRKRGDVTAEAGPAQRPDPCAALTGSCLLIPAARRGTSEWATAHRSGPSRWAAPRAHRRCQRPITAPTHSASAGSRVRDVTVVRPGCCPFHFSGSAVGPGSPLAGQLNGAPVRDDLIDAIDAWDTYWPRRHGRLRLIAADSGQVPVGSPTGTATYSSCGPGRQRWPRCGTTTGWGASWRAAGRRTYGGGRRGGPAPHAAAPIDRSPVLDRYEVRNRRRGQWSR